MIEKRYDQLEVGEYFVLIRKRHPKQNIFMKINFEKDHNYCSVIIDGPNRGDWCNPLSDDWNVMALTDEEVWG